MSSWVFLFDFTFQWTYFEILGIYMEIDVRVEILSWPKYQSGPVITRQKYFMRNQNSAIEHVPCCLTVVYWHQINRSKTDCYCSLVKSPHVTFYMWNWNVQKCFTCEPHVNHMPTTCVKHVKLSYMLNVDMWIT